MGKFSHQLEIQKPVIDRLKKKQQELGIYNVSFDDFVQALFIGSLFLLEKENKIMIDFIKANTMLDN